MLDHHVQHTFRHTFGGVAVEIVTSEPYQDGKHFWGKTEAIAFGNGNPSLLGRERITFSSIDKALAFLEEAKAALTTLRPE